MLVNVLRPNRMAHGVWRRMVLKPISFGPAPHRWAWIRMTVAAFCTRTSPPPKGMLSTMALLSRIMATETAVVVAHANAITVEEGG